jgi:hypothetical protein
MSTISNFPKYVAIYRPAERGYQVVFIDDGKFNVLTSSVSGGLWFHVGKCKEFPQDDMFQVVRPSGPDGKEVYYWPTGFELVRNVPKTWPKEVVVRYPIFQFLKPPVGLGLTVIPAVASGEMNATWASAMKVIRSAALLEYREFKDLPGLVSQPVTIASVPMPPLEDMDDGTMADDEMPPLDKGDMIEHVGTEISYEENHWASLDILMDAAKRGWWHGWRRDGHFRKRIRVLDLDMLEPVEFLHYLRLVSSVNNRVAISSGGKMIPLKFTAEEVDKIKKLEVDEGTLSEIVGIMSEYLV